MGDVVSAGDHARELHDQAAAWDSGAVTIAALGRASAARLTDLNRRHLLNGGTVDLQLQDPRDLVARIESMCGAILVMGSSPRMDQAEAIGAYALALGLAVARVEDGRLDLGSAA